ncbi:multimerin-2-like isoform X4 [Sinocyclocheilus rhinocerous]|uniref:multimerin-2-like isoform X2 n=2 Tax=Sinocyclocheilus rhinocerous TaxID=307959 RepID=UPI0007B9A505|nr:PREDICTED: multimerin-2-like isoform X2 [Sinocyclocheilus rhinocerous]XP_016412327.1 PREDICTED: multimerin-2-like isoform X4 [Sinocyclocheilus rhinocerous]
MVVLRLVMLLQGLLLAARCEVRARDPEVEEEDELKDMSDGRGWDHRVPLVGFGAPHHGQGLNRQSPDVYASVHHPLGHGHHDPTPGHLSPDMPKGTGDPSDPSGATETKGSLPRTGNWCAFVHKHAVTVAVSCGTEKYTIKSQSPCPNGTPDCQLVMYKLSTRPVYRQKEKIYTALLWRCCPGHAGENCEETVTDGHISESEDPTMAGTAHPGRHEATDRRYNKLTQENREQKDYQMFGGPLYETQQPDVENQTAAEPIDDYEHSPHSVRDRHDNQHFERRDPHAVNEGVPHPEIPYLHHGLLPILKEAVMSQLQPVLENFNLTLERLFQEVQGLQRDMDQLRHEQGQGRVAEPLEVGGEEHNPQEAVEAELRESFQKLEEVKAQFRNHRNEVEARLHAQQIMLHYNLTNFKTDMDVKIKRNQKMLQVNLHSLNTSMSEVRQEQERLDKELQKIWHEKKTDPAQSQSYESTAVWEAITRLDNKVINNTVRLSGLIEGQEQVTENIKDLQNGWRDLDKKIVQTGRNSQVQFMETGLEVEAAKVAVLDRINELSSNISVLQSTMQEMETDVDHLYAEFYKNISSASGDCDCIALGASVTQLEQTVANVMKIANENKLTRKSASQEMLDNQDNGAWIPSVEDLKLGLLNVQKSLAFEQEKSRMLQHNVTQLQASLLGSLQDIETLQEQDRVKVEKIQQLHSIFNTLLQDAIRHSEILEILLEEEVLEFILLSHEDKRRFSIPELRESIREMQEQINGHSRSLASMLNSATPQVAAADEPSVLSDWVSVGTKRRRGDERFDLSKELPEYSDDDFWTLEKMVKELGAHIKQLEEHHCPSCCNCTKTSASGGVEVKLQSEVEVLRKDLETHLGVFNSIFSNTEGLTGSEVSVDLNKLLALMKRKEAKQQNRKQKKRADNRAVQTGERVNYRSRRDASLESAVLRQLPDSPIMFLASTTEGTNGSGTILFESVTLNHGQLYSPKTGIFRAPTSGAYLFVVTLDFGPGPSLAQLKRGGEVAASLRQSPRKLGAPATRVCILQLEQGEELRLELVQGTIECNNPQDNTFAGLLMLQTT